MPRRHGHDIDRGISCNDRKFEQVDVQFFEKGADGAARRSVRRLQAYVVPKDGFRGSAASHFKVVVDDVVIESPDIRELQRKASDVLQALRDEDWEKVLVVKTAGDPAHHSGFRHGEDFGLQWTVGWRVAKLGLVFDEDRRFTLDVENHDEHEVDSPVEEGGFRIGSSSGRSAYRDDKHKTAVVSWTQAREDVLARTVMELAEMRARANAALLEVESFAALLDSPNRLHLLGDGK